jgi:hypothetical protein
VELPGIEPGPKIALSWENPGFEDTKRREIPGTTGLYVKGVDGVNARIDASDKGQTRVSP